MLESLATLEPPVRRRLIAYLSDFLTQSRRERMDAVLKQRTRFVTLVLEDIYQPHNVAAVLRSAECFGVQDVHAIENRNIFDDEGSPVSMGADKWLDQHRWNTPGEDNTTACLTALKEQGTQLLAMTLGEGSIPLEEAPLDRPTAILIGTEKKGLSQTAHELADHFVHIPMVGFTQSFNLSVCAALCLRDLTSRMRKANLPWALKQEEQEQLHLDWLCRSIATSAQLIETFFASQEAS